VPGKKLLQRKSRKSVIEALEGRTLLSFSFASAVSTVDGKMLALPGAVQSGDINLDGKTDIVLGVNSASSTQSLTGTDILTSNGDRHFTAVSGPTFPGTSLGTSTDAFVVADINGDNKPDLVYLSEDGTTGGGVVTPEINQSGGGSVSFAAGTATAIANPGSFNPQEVVAGDFNGDGKMDLAVIGLSGPSGETLVFLTGNGSGGFTEGQDFALNGVYDGQLLTGDFNDDGLLDVAVYDPAGSDVTAFLNQSAGGSIAFSQVSAPFNVGLSGFTSGPAAAADLNGDGRTDLVVAENGSGGVNDQVMVLLSGANGGNLTFTAQQPVSAGNPSGDFVGAMTTGDFDGDGKIDVAEDYGVLLNNGAGVLTAPAAGLGSGLLADAEGYNSIQAADLDGDGKLDLVGVEQSSHTVYAAVNTSVFTAAAATTTVVSSTLNPAFDNESVPFTATVTSNAGTPSGDVELFDGSTLLGTHTLSGGTAQFSDVDPTDGIHSITAKYLGNANFAASTSAVFSETITAPVSLTTVKPVIASVTLPSVFVPGDIGTVNLSIDNQQSIVAKGIVGIQLYATTDGTIGNATLLTAPTVAHVALNLKAGASKTLKARFVVPLGIAPGTYFVAAVLTPISGFATSAVSSTPAVSTSSAVAALEFGTVGNRSNVKLNQVLSDGTKVTYRLSGPGTGTISSSNGAVSLSLSGTSSASNLTVTAVGGAGSETLTGITADAAMRGIIAAKVNLLGNLSIAGSVGQILLGNVTNGTLTLGGSSAVKLTAATVTSSSIQSSAPFSSLTVGNWTDPNITPGEISSPWIGTLTSKAGFRADLDLSGVGAPGAVSLKSARIAGDLGSVQWSIGGSATSITVGGNFTGDLGAGSISTLSIKGSMSASDILAGTGFGADGKLGGGDDTYAGGSIKSVHIGGAVDSSLIAAGLDPIDSVYLNGNDVLIGGSDIGSLTVGGALSSDSHVLATTVPTKAKIDGVSVTTAGDPRFTLS
jgi:Bacterial Ig-like domain (group 3)/FG-GAP-like repeat